MTISFMRFLLGLLLLLIPVYLIYRFRLNLMKRYLTALARLIVFLLIMGGAIELTFLSNNQAVNVLLALLLTFCSALFTLGRTRLSKAKLLLPVSVGLLVPTLIVALFMVFVVFGQKQPFSFQYFLPLAGIFTGAAIGINSKALSTYYMGLTHHNQLYYYLLGNGASHREATNYFLRRGLQASLIPSISQMAYMVVAVCPVVLWVSILNGMDVVTSLELQVLFMVAVMAVAPTSLFLTILLARKYSFDEYERLRPMKKNSASAPDPSPQHQEENPAQEA